eukprot:CAMPEP_0172048622 /NCGR_PEP_ID=MMETSP1043-20130122/1628_1 /TAXON_ID=464988 /ORGANISM="Hemiselmis andersenii, Strain CCMP441" /LENGTH=116 /DNA_ID=CAMNT_0012707531 /DNA_START=93 /DNA_END=440 /DNA_ORIENTATION=+
MVPLPQHIDPLHKNRQTPGPVREAFYVTDPHSGRQIPIEETTSKRRTPSYSMSGTALAPTSLGAGAGQQTPDPGSTTSTIGKQHPVLASGSSYSIGVDCLGRGGKEVTHLAVHTRG